MKAVGRMSARDRGTLGTFTRARVVPTEWKPITYTACSQYMIIRQTLPPSLPAFVCMAGETSIFQQTLHGVHNLLVGPLLPVSLFTNQLRRADNMYLGSVQTRLADAQPPML